MLCARGLVIPQSATGKFADLKQAVEEAIGMDLEFHSKLLNSAWQVLVSES